MYALIEKATNKIVRIGTEYIELPAGKPFKWVACPDNCSASWSFDGTNFAPPAEVPPPPQDPAVVAAKVKTNINAGFESAITSLKSGYPASEILSWDQQVIEAKQHAADPAAPMALLDGVALQRGVDRTLLAGKVLEKAALFAQASGVLIGRRQHLEDVVDAVDLNAPDAVEQLNAIVWSLPQ